MSVPSRAAVRPRQALPAPSYVAEGGAAGIPFILRGPEGGVGTGLGQTTSAGTVTLINPTVAVTTTG